MDGLIAPFHYTDQRKNSVPDRTDRPVLGIKSTKNYITANAVEAILAVPQVRARTEPDYLNKADYGRVPAYLSQVKEEIRRENDLIDAFVNEQMGYSLASNEPPMETLPDEERGQLIRDLKHKWDVVNSKYQKMCHMVNLDTMGKVKR